MWDIKLIFFKMQKNKNLIGREFFQIKKKKACNICNY